MRRTAACALAAMALLGMMCGSSAAAKAAPANGLVVFGDSLSDSRGNYLKFSKGEYPDPKWYLAGRSAGGPMWPDYLSVYRKLVQKNYAHYGATACSIPNSIKRDNATKLLIAPDGLDQVGMYLKRSTSAQRAKNVHIIFLGANDYLMYFLKAARGLINPLQTPPPTAATVVPCLGAIAKTLLKKGATKIVFSDLPSLAIAPAFAKATPEAKALASAIIDSHNLAVKQLVVTLRKGYPKAKIVFFPTSTISVSTFKNYKRFGLIDRKNTALVINKPLPSYPFIGPSALRPKSKRYYFFDEVHPTASVHRIFAKQYEAILKKAKV